MKYLDPKHFLKVMQGCHQVTGEKDNGYGEKKG